MLTFAADELMIKIFRSSHYNTKNKTLIFFMSCCIIHQDVSLKTRYLTKKVRQRNKNTMKRFTNHPGPQSLTSPEGTYFPMLTSNKKICPNIEQGFALSHFLFAHWSERPTFQPSMTYYIAVKNRYWMKKQLKHALATDCLFRPPFCNQTGYQTSSWFFWVKIELVPSALQKKNVHGRNKSFFPPKFLSCVI